MNTVVGTALNSCAAAANPDGLAVLQAMIAAKLTGQQRDEADMARLLTGDDGALENLMARHARGLFRFLLRLTHDRTEASELTHEAFVRVYQSRQSFNFRCAFSTWLYTIAANLGRDRLRRRARQPQVVPLHFVEADDTKLFDELVDPASIPGEHLQAQERLSELNGALASLPEKLRTPLVLAACEDQPLAQIASLLQCTPKSVEMRLYYARKRLRKRRAEFFGDSLRDTTGANVVKGRTTNRSTVA